MNRSMDEPELLARLAALPRERAPDRDVWDAIAARTGEAAGKERRRTRFLFPAALAATVLLALAISLNSGRGPTLTVPTASSPPPVSVGGPSQDEAGRAAWLSPSELEYRAALREYVDLGLTARQDPEPGAPQLAEGWLEMQAAERAMLSAIARHPDSRLLQARLNDLRHRQLDFLKSLALMDTRFESSPRSNNR